MKDLEEKRAFWAEIAKKHGWYTEPFYIQVFVNKKGEITDSVSFTGLDQDVVVLDDEEEEEE